MFQLIKKSDLRTSSWLGGTTTQLLIFPESAEYQKFNFDFRISIATVEIEESTFTVMPKVTRHLMILKGALELEHIEKYKIRMNKFDVCTFSGEWPTKAKGKVTDFNLMTTGSTKGKLESLKLTKGENNEILKSKNESLSGIYLYKGKLILKYKNETITLKKGDFLLLKWLDNPSCLINAQDSSEIVISRLEIKKSL
ncbi:MAG: HutD family protein [Bacteroidota bacterium]|nr:HutD family protein [Bacteroidota bacterium]